MEPKGIKKYIYTFRNILAPPFLKGGKGGKGRKNYILLIYKMAFVSDFAFNNISRIGDDSCSQDINSIENAQACSYLLQNYFTQDCSMSKARQLAVTQPCINYSGTMGSDICGSNIDDSSRLLIGTIQTHPRCRIDLFQRPFATVPFLGRGSVCPILEAQIQQG